jgi:hypothetical protein
VESLARDVVTAGAAWSGAAGSGELLCDSVMSGRAPFKRSQHPARTWGFSMAELGAYLTSRRPAVSSPGRWGSRRSRARREPSSHHRP